MVISGSVGPVGIRTMQVDEFCSDVFYVFAFCFEYWKVRNSLKCLSLNMHLLYYCLISEYLRSSTGLAKIDAICSTAEVIYGCLRCTSSDSLSTHISSNISSSGLSIERCRTYAMLLSSLRVGSITLIKMSCSLSPKPFFAKWIAISLTELLPLLLNFSMSVVSNSF